MSAENTKEDILQPTSLQEAINVIKFLNTTHKQEMAKLKEAYLKQTSVIKKLETNRKMELEFLSGELQKYELNLAIRTEAVAKQLSQKDNIIQKQVEIIEDLNKKLKIREDFPVPEINVLAAADSNSDSGVALDNDESSTHKSEENKTDAKIGKKCCRRFAESISFLRRVDFSPMRYKPCNREGTKKKDEKKNSLEVPFKDKRLLSRQFSNDRPMSDDERCLSTDQVDKSVESFMSRPKTMIDSQNNNFSDDGSEDTSEEAFERVMTRNSVRRSVKANPKYKKINRNKSKLLEQVKVNIVD